MGQPVFLQGTPSAIGGLLGSLQREVLQERLARVQARAAATETEQLLAERAERFREVLRAAAPHWLEEAAAMAGAQEPGLLALNCLPADFWGRDYQPAPIPWVDLHEQTVNAYEAEGVDQVLGGDCTTFFALGPATLAGETLLHKNRDERDEVQCIYVKSTTARPTFVGAGDVGNLGTAHLHGANGWAGANNTGSPVLADEYQDCALTDSHVMRFLAEQCIALDDILPALQHLIDNMWLGGGGPGFGMILVFADAVRALVVEATSRRLAYRWFEDDAMEVRTNHFLLPEMQEWALAASDNSTMRYRRATELWLENRGYASIPLCGEVARDRRHAPHAICRNPSDGLGSVTVSASTATISLREDRCQTHFRNCHPGYTPGVIMTPLERVSDSDLVSGAHNQYWRRYRGNA